MPRQQVLKMANGRQTKYTQYPEQFIQEKIQRRTTIPYYERVLHDRPINVIIDSGSPVTLVPKHTIYGNI